MKKQSEMITKINIYLKTSKDYQYKEDALKYLNNKKNNFFDDELLAQIITIIIDNNTNFNKAISDAKNLYDIIIFNQDNIEERTMFIKLFEQYETKLNSNIGIELIGNIYALFENHKLAINLFNILSTDAKMGPQVISKIYEYMISARQYYVDETAFYASLLQIIEKIKTHEYSITYVQKIIDEALEQDKKIAGIYEIDENKIKECVKKVEELEKRRIEIEEKLNSAMTLVNNLYKELEKSESFNKETLIKLRETYNEIQKMISEFKVSTNLPSHDKQEITTAKLDTLIEELTKYNNSQNNLTTIQHIDTNQPQVIPPQPRPKFDGTNFLYDLVINNIIAQIRESIEKNVKFSPCFNSEEKETFFRNKIKEMIDLNEVNESVIKDLEIPQSTFQFLRAYYFALYNDNVDLLNDIIKLIPIDELEIQYLDKAISSVFEKKEHINLVINNAYTLKKFYEAKKLELLRELILINPKYILKYVTYSGFLKSKLDIEKLNNAIEVFGMEKIASNDEKLDKIIDEADDIEAYKIIKQIYDINSSFELSIGIKYIIKAIDLFSIEEISSFTEKNQKNLKLIMDSIDWWRSDYNDVINKYRDSIRKIILSTETKAIIHFYVLEMTEKSLIDLDTYLSLDYKESESILEMYKNIKRIKEEKDLFGIRKKQATKKLVKQIPTKTNNN